MTEASHLCGIKSDKFVFPWPWAHFPEFPQNGSTGGEGSIKVGLPSLPVICTYIQ